MLFKNHIFFLTKKRGVTRDLQIGFLSLSLFTICCCWRESGQILCRYPDEGLAIGTCRTMFPLQSRKTNKLPWVKPRLVSGKNKQQEKFFCCNTAPACLILGFPNIQPIYMLTWVCVNTHVDRQLRDLWASFFFVCFPESSSFLGQTDG